MHNSIIDFSDSFVFPTNNYSGNDEKEKIKYQGDNYLIKFRNTTKRRNDLTSPLANNIFSEYIGCHIIETIGIPVQETFLGFFKGEYVVACKDFTIPGVQLAEFADLGNTFMSRSKLKPHPTLDAVLACYEQRFNADSSHPFRQAFWDLFIVDAFIGNFDRHAGNWGFLVNDETGQICLAPIYDCGSCLYPGLGEHSLLDILSDSDKINERIYQFPGSAIYLNGQRIPYFDYISSLENEECTAALLRIYPKISMEKVNNVIDNTPLISEERKNFYKVFLAERFDKILTVSYEKAMNQMKTRKPSLDSQISNAAKRLGPSDPLNNIPAKGDPFR